MFVQNHIFKHQLLKVASQILHGSGADDGVSWNNPPKLLIKSDKHDILLRTLDNQTDLLLKGSKNTSQEILSYKINLRRALNKHDHKYYLDIYKNLEILEILPKLNVKEECNIYSYKAHKPIHTTC